MARHPVFDAASYPILVQQDGRVVYHNPAAERLARDLGAAPHALADAAAFFGSVPFRELLAAVSGEDVDACLPREGAGPAQRGSALVAVVGTSWEGRPALWFGLLGGPQRAGAAGGDGADLLARLSRRERQVAELIARGYSTLNVAAVLGVTEGTVRDHVKATFRKLGVHSRMEVARIVGFPPIRR